MKRPIAMLSVAAIAVVTSVITGFAEDKKAMLRQEEVVYLKGRTCSELPADIQGRSMGCDQVTIRSRSYAKVKVGYASFEKQAMESDDLAMQHGG